MEGSPGMGGRGAERNEGASRQIVFFQKDNVAEIEISGSHSAAAPRIPGVWPAPEQRSGVLASVVGIGVQPTENKLSNLKWPPRDREDFID